MPKSPKKRANNEPDEPVTQFFNFPGAWVKDYDPQIHGIRPASHLQDPQFQPTPLPQMPPGQVQQPVNGQQQPDYPPEPRGYNLLGPQLNQNQWNPSGVYGGLPEAKKRPVPWWAWVVMALLVLMIVLIAISILRIYPAF